MFLYRDYTECFNLGRFNNKPDCSAFYWTFERFQLDEKFGFNFLEISSDVWNIILPNFPKREQP